MITESKTSNSPITPMNFDEFTFSRFSNVFDKSPPAETTIEETWREIRAGTYSPLVESIRNAPNKDEKSRLKLKLPAITPQAHFLTGERSKTAPHQPRPVIVIDIDGLSPEDADRVRTDLGRDPHCFLSFLSPSGEGVKAFLAISDARKDPRDIFYSAETYIKKEYGLQIDSKCIGPDRACFVSSDGGAIYKGEATPLKIVTKPKPELSPYSAEKPRNYESPNGESPIDEYSNQAGQETFEALLSAHGWTPASHDRLKWTRPGKSHGTSGVINPPDSRIGVWSFYSHSSSVDFDTSKALTAGALFAALEHGGDFKAATKDLASKGFGEQIEPKSKAPPELPATVEIDEPDLKPFPTVLMPEAFQGFVKNVAALNSIPESMVAATMFSAVSTALGNSVGVESLPGSVAKANLFILSLAKSGTGKGRTQSTVMKPLYEAVLAAEQHRRASEEPIARKKIADLEAEIEDLIDAGGDPEALNLEKAELEKLLTTEHVIVSDTTTETMLGYLGNNSHPSCLSLSAEASQQLQNMSGRYSSNKGTNDDGTFCDLYSGDAVSYNRKSESHSLIGSTVGVCWMTQPHVFLDILGDKNKIEGGFFARFLMHDCRAEITGWPEKVKIDSKSHDLWRDLILHLFGEYRAKSVPDPILLVPTSPEFSKVMKDYYNECALRAREETIEQMVPFHLRHCENAFRLALVLHMMRHFSDPFGNEITGEDGCKAIIIVKWFSEQQRDLLFPLLASKAQEKAEKLASWVAMVKEAGEVGLPMSKALKSSHMTASAFKAELEKMPEIQIREAKSAGSNRAANFLFWAQNDTN